MSSNKAFTGAAGEIGGAGFVAPKSLIDLKPATVDVATTTVVVAQGGWAMEVKVPKLPPEEAQRRSLEVHHAARARNERQDALRRAKLAAQTKTLG